MLSSIVVQYICKFKNIPIGLGKDKLMIKLIINLLILSFLANCSVIGGKSEDKNEDNMKNLSILLLGTATTQIKFRLDSGTQKDVGCSTENLASSGETISGGSNVTLKDARFFVYDVKLIKAGGGRQAFSLSSNDYQNTYTEDGTKYRVALIDFADNSGDCSSGAYSSSVTTELNKKLKGSPAYGLFTGVEFKIGLPNEVNNLRDITQEAPLNDPGMYWDWNSMYKFMKLELNHSNGNILAWHGGNTTCSGSVGSRECTYENVPTIKVNKSSGYLNSSTEIVLNIKDLMDGTDTVGAALGCHSGPQGNMMGADANCARIGKNMGIDIDGTAASTQSAFSIP
jgi:uncharacterized repeat protein (TIGR04052 family)